MEMMKQTIADQLSSSTFSEPKHSVGSAFSDLLRRHGEVMLVLASGDTWAVHLGDVGRIAESFLRFIDDKGGERFIFFDQVEQLWAHRSSKE